ncbi:MAG: hypothetical protein FWC46_02170, partial [Actinomycetia bacterium]|nr:hypothetical protein [Actinomycetes bacterium]
MTSTESPVPGVTIGAPRRSRFQAWRGWRPVEREPARLVWGASWSTVARLRDDVVLRRDEALSWLVTAVLTVLAFAVRFPNLKMPAY